MRSGCGLLVQSTSNSTGGRAHGPMAMLFLFLFEWLDVVSSYRRDTEIRSNMSGVDRHETGFFLNVSGPGLFDPAWKSSPRS